MLNLISTFLAIVFAAGLFVGLLCSNPNGTSMCHYPTTIQKFTPGFMFGCKIGDMINKENK